MIIQDPLKMLMILIRFQEYLKWRNTNGIYFKQSIADFKNPGVTSRQLLNPNNSNNDKVTITEVHLKSNAKQSRHSHEFSEQIWYALKGNGRLLLANDNEQKFTEGDVVRFEAGDIHGLYNDSDEEFVYISVTTPPIDFSYAYKEIGKK